MQQHIFSAFWVQKCIESCTSQAQLNNAKKLVELYYKQFTHMFFYKHLESVWIQHKEYLNHEQNN